MAQEALWILELRGVPGVRVNKQLGVGNVARHIERIDRRDHYVVHTIQDEGRVLDITQVGEGVVFREPWLIQNVGLDLGVHYGWGAGWVLIFALVSTLPEGASCLFCDL